MLHPNEDLTHTYIIQLSLNGAYIYTYLHYLLWNIVAAREVKAEATDVPAVGGAENIASEYPGFNKLQDTCTCIYTRMIVITCS